MLIDLTSIQYTFALTVALVAAYFGYRRYRTKVGHALIGRFIIENDTGAPDHFIKKIQIENLKDRPVAVYAIYVRLRAGAYLLVDDLNDSPLIIPPYSVHKKTYDAVVLYKQNMTRYSINNSLSIWKREAEPPRLVLNTNFGKVVTKESKTNWNPEWSKLTNKHTLVIKPHRNNLDGKSYPPAAQFIIKLTHESGFDEELTIDTRSWKCDEFAYFDLPEHVLENGRTLYDHLSMLQSWNVLNAKKIEVIDLKSTNRSLLAATVGADNSVEYVSRYNYCLAQLPGIKKWFERLPVKTRRLIRYYRFF